jgi:hypothetical protein
MGRTAHLGIVWSQERAKKLTKLLKAPAKVADSAGYPAGGAMLVPGALIGLAAALPAIRSALTEIGGRLMTRSPARP